MLLNHLTIAERHITNGDQHLRRQRQIVASVKRRHPGSETLKKALTKIQLPDSPRPETMGASQERISVFSSMYAGGHGSDAKSGARNNALQQPSLAAQANPPVRTASATSKGQDALRDSISCDYDQSSRHAPKFSSQPKICYPVFRGQARTAITNLTDEREFPLMGWSGRVLQSQVGYGGDSGGEPRHNAIHWARALAHY
jgi:hypothetical protein